MYDDCKSNAMSDTSPRTYGLGIDAGGTYTDAVLYDFTSQTVLWKNKALTTPWDFPLGITRALEGLESTHIPRIKLVAVSTTLATNAVVEGQGRQVGLLVMPPDEHFAPAEIGHTPTACIQGRLTIDGSVLQEINPEQIVHTARQMVARHEVKAFAVSAYAGGINPILEIQAKEVLRRETGLSVTCGHELSSLLNFLVRARTAVLNARIIPRVERFITNLETVLQDHGLLAPISLVKGDGSLIALETARERPVETILSGPAASLAGAGHQTGLQNAVVVDIGGTTTDIASLRDGQAVISQSGARLDEHRTHVKAIDIQTKGLGGDSLITLDRQEVRIGPRRVIPLAWLATQTPELDEALDYILEHFDSLSSQAACTEFLTALYPVDAHGLRPEEHQILELCRQRPHSLLELTAKTSALSWRLLPLARLEAAGMIQRAGLTPTDLLHVRGDFTSWDVRASQRMVELFADFFQLEPKAFIHKTLGDLTRALAMEILQTQWSPGKEHEDQTLCPMCRKLLDTAFQDGNPDYRVHFSLTRPIVGIGAPAHIFLPPVGDLLHSEVIIPEDAAVANAIGAITSFVKIEKQIRIKPNNGSGYYLEGVPGKQVFYELESAEQWAGDYLRAELLKIGRLNRAEAADVRINSEQSSVHTGREKLFLSLTVTGRLQGRPAALA